VAPSGEEEQTALKVRNYSPSSAQQPQRYFEKLLPVRLLVRINLFDPSHFYPRDATRKRGTCYGNVAGWLGWWLAG